MAREFGTAKGQTAHLYELEGEGGLRAQLTDYGATLVALFVKDKNGVERDVVCGYDSATDYERENCFFGATVGRNANRIANSKVTISGVTYDLEVNDNENNLHSGSNGLGDRMWQVKEQSKNAITFTILDEAFSDDFPGNLTMDVTYTLTADNTVEIHYVGSSDADTVCNFTNHSYFNLNGHDSGTVHGHKLLMNAANFTPIPDGKAIPTGEIAPVAGTPLDFTEEKTIGRDINADYDQLVFVNGYDHNFVIDEDAEFVARVTGEESGIVMVMKTDLPGVQLYTGNWIGGQVGKGGATYVKQGALCLESQYFPNAANQEGFASPILLAGEVYDTTTVYQFL